MTGREFQQLISLVLGVITLSIVVYKARRGFGSTAIWIPLAVINVATIIFYSLLFLKVGFDGNEWSVTLRVITQFAILLYAIYMPPLRGRK